MTLVFAPSIKSFNDVTTTAPSIKLPEVLLVTETDVNEGASFPATSWTAFASLADDGSA
jgi:hypothetical protein